MGGRRITTALSCRARANYNGAVRSSGTPYDLRCRRSNWRRRSHLTARTRSMAEVCGDRERTLNRDMAINGSEKEIAVIKEPDDRAASLESDVTQAQASSAPSTETI